MRGWLLDTGIANDLFNKRDPVESRVRTVLAQGDHVGIGTPVLGELRAGIENSHSRDQNWLLLKRGLARLRVWSFDKPATEEFGRLLAELRRGDTVEMEESIAHARCRVSLAAALSRQCLHRTLASEAPRQWHPASIPDDSRTKVLSPRAVQRICAPKWAARKRFKGFMRRNPFPAI